MYWLGQILALVAGLIGVAIVRDWLRLRWPLIARWHLDISLIVLLLLGIALSASTRRTEVKQAANLERTVGALRDYLEVSRLAPQGVTGTGLKETSQLSEALEEAWIERDGKLFPSCNNLSLDKFRHATTLSPKFPWAHYGLAVEIFELTTQLSGHHSTHDQALKELRGYLSASESQ